MTGLLAGQMIENITVSEDNSETAYVVLSNYTDNNKVYKTINGGTKWVNISLTGLPAVPVNCIIHQKNNHDRVYVGTDLGIYYTDSTLTTWKNYNNGLPNTIILDLDIYYPSYMLRAATYGRGIWESRLLVDEVGGMADVDFANNVVVYPNPTTNKINIALNYKSNQSTTIKICNLDGKELVTEQIPNLQSNMEVDLANIGSGVYLVSISNGGKLVNKKFVVVPN